MKNLFIAILLTTLSSVSLAAPTKIELGLGFEETYIVEEINNWSVQVKNYKPSRTAKLVIFPNEKNKNFNLELYFSVDNCKLGCFNTPKKMKAAVFESSQKYLPNAVEKKIDIEEILNKGWYGYKTKLTNKDLYGKKIPPNEYLYIIRGMIPLSTISVLEFKLLTNDPKSEQTQSIFAYIYSLAQLNKCLAVDHFYYFCSTPF